MDFPGQITHIQKQTKKVADDKKDDNAKHRSDLAIFSSQLVFQGFSLCNAYKNNKISFCLNVVFFKDKFLLFISVLRPTNFL